MKSEKPLHCKTGPKVLLMIEECSFPYVAFSMVLAVFCFIFLVNKLCKG